MVRDAWRRRDVHTPAGRLVDDLRALILEAVGETIGDDDVCCLVSGGLDSSAVYCAALALGHRPHTVTGYYNHDGFDERDYARRVVTWPADFVEITPRHFSLHFDEFARLMEHPY